MKTRGINTAKLLVDVTEVDTNLLRIIDRNTRGVPVKEDVVVYNHLNEIIYCNCDDNMPVQYLTNNVVDKIWLNHELRMHNGDSEVIGFIYMGKTNRFVVVVSAYDQFGINKLKYLRLILVLGFVFSVTIILISGWIFTGQMLKPVARIAKEADQITGSDFKVRINEGNRTDELARLAMTFNRMLDRLEKSFEIQRSFVSNSSHELRTPLTAIRGQIEVSLLKERTSNEYKEILVSVLEDIASLIALSNNLLDIARASTDTWLHKPEKTRIDEQLFFAREELLHLQPHYKINVTISSFSDLEEKLTITGNEQLLRCAFMNLMENGCKYSVNHSVEVFFHCHEEQIMIDFSDNGIGIPAKELDYVLTPFYRASNAGKHSGHGLGLTLTAKIIELHKGRLNISSVPNNGTSVKIYLPT
ncbi:MAG: HAMP domain-containing histidine kinase, partial [Bacteroidia bacterium]|nr:HAMP domain-containing histidine kinase [Bacteroidia bacterium]